MIALTDELLTHYMNLSLDEAKKAALENEVPVGAIVVKDGSVIATASNKTESANDPTAHAEILAIRDAAKALGNWRLNDCLLCVTLEPCPMCAAAILQARIPTIIFSAADERMGALGSMFDLTESMIYPGKTRVIRGICAEQSRELLQSFFKKQRS
jgi:tRNA(adenine34) deaminase